MRKRLCLCGLLLLAGLWGWPAEAALKACNRTSYVLYAAAAALKMPDVEARGWTRIIPGACAEVLPGDLSADGYYLYARSSRAHGGAPRAWSGPVSACVKDKDFAAKSAFGARCPEGSYELGFAQIDTHHMRDWNATFRETPDLPDMPSAERLGLKRLLSDSGVRTDDKGLDKAIAAFKTKAHLAANAPTSALFNALETEALKSAVPAGYSVCNDTGAPFYAAIGQQNGNTFSAKGWWTVAAGACAPLITDPISGQKIWLRVERGKGPALVGGPNGFCVASVEFDIQGRQDCQKRGLIPAGFAETNTKGAAGFTAHVTGNGLR